MNRQRSILIGIVSGIVFAVVIVVLAKIGGRLDESEVLRQTINFVVALPAVIFTTLKMPHLLQNISFFIYWALVGGIWGWLLSPKNVLSKIPALFFLAGLIILHHLANVKMSREMGELLEAFGQWLTGGF